MLDSVPFFWEARRPLEGWRLCLQMDAHSYITVAGFPLTLVGSDFSFNRDDAAHVALALCLGCLGARELPTPQACPWSSDILSLLTWPHWQEEAPESRRGRRQHVQMKKNRWHFWVGAHGPPRAW